MSEIFPTEIRGQGTAVGMFNQFAAQIIILVAGPIALNNIGWKFFLVLICPTAVYIPIIYFFPETRQRSLEDINAQFGETVAVHYFNATEEEEKEYAKAIEVEELSGHSLAANAIRQEQQYLHYFHQQDHIRCCFAKAGLKMQTD